MEQTFDIANLQQAANEKAGTIKKWIDGTSTASIIVLLISVIISIAGFVVIWHFGNTDPIKIPLLMIIAGIAMQVVAIICFMIYNGMLRTIKNYRNELIVLSDLSTAIELAGKLPATIERRVAGKTDDTSKNKVDCLPRSKLQEQIIQTLLSRCSK